MRVLNVGLNMPKNVNFAMRMPHKNSLVGPNNFSKLSDPPSQNNALNSLKKDTVSFSKSISKYIKKYATLPDEIKKILSPKDAVDMFQDMEMVASGTIKRDKIGFGTSSKVYETPFLDDYCFIVLADNKTPTQTIYSKMKIGDAVWKDNDNSRIQILSAPLNNI